MVDTTVLSIKTFVPLSAHALTVIPATAIKHAASPIILPIFFGFS